MSSYRYKITVESLSNVKEAPTDVRNHSFEVANHEDILEIVEQMRARLPFDEDTIASLGVGVETVLRGIAYAAKRSNVREDWACIEGVCS